MQARVARWSGGKQAAISLRFDGSDATHIERALPMLNAAGLVGTFMVSPATADYQRYREAWEGDVVRQGHELGNGTLRGLGGQTDRAAERELGSAAATIRRAQASPRLLALVSADTAQWLQRKPLRYFLTKYDLFGPSAAAAPVYALSCGQQNPSFSIAAFTRTLDRAIANGGWMQPDFRAVGEGPQSISPANLQKLLKTTAARRGDLWVAGISAIYQYDQERERARVWARSAGDDAVALDLACSSDARLFQQPLTLEFDLPPGAQTVEVMDAAGAPVAARIDVVGEKRVARFDVPPTDAAYTIRAAGLGTAYRDAGVVDLVSPGPHPYLFFSRGDLAQLREKSTQGITAHMWDRILEIADGLTANEPGWQAARGGYDNQRLVRTLAFAYVMTGKDIYARRAKVELEAMLARRPGTRIGPGSGDNLNALALAYDWLYDALSEDERTRTRAAIAGNIEAVLAVVERGDTWTTWRRSNWGGVIYGGGGVASLAILDEDPRAAEWARFFRRQIWDYVWTLGPDGGWGESGGYGMFAWFRCALFMDAHDRVVGREDLFRNPNVPHLWKWFTELLEPDEVSFIPFSNVHKYAAETAPELYRVAAAYREGHAQWFADRMTERRVSADVFSFIWRDPTLPPAPPDDLPKARLFSDIDWAMLRSRWGDPAATLLSLKGGQKDWDHHHNDTNAIVLYAYGRPLLVDLLYVYKAESSRTPAHNTIMVNEREQRGYMSISGTKGDPNHRGIIGGFLDAPWYAHVVGDASLAYEPDDVRSFVREIMYLRRTEEAAPPDYFVMLDDVDATKAAPMDWFLHTYGDVAIDGSRITFTQDEAVLDITMVAPAAFTIERTERSFEETGSDRPFETAAAFRGIKLRPTEPTDRGLFLSVLSPRPSADGSALTVNPIREANLLGADIRTATTHDLALFAVDAPAMRAGGVEAMGRSCFVRRAGERVLAAALHGGRWLAVEGRRLFETDGSGQAAISFTDESIEASLDLDNGHMVRLFSPQRPVRVLVDGVARPVIYDAERHQVEISGDGMSRVSLLLR
jgi:hypothetical protein